MKRQLLIILIFILTDTFVVGQIYTGISHDKYQTLLRIDKDSSIKFTYNLDQEIYAEHLGTIKKINDSVYHISATMTFGNNEVMSLYTYDTVTHITNDTDYFSITIPFVDMADTVIIRYANGQTRNYLPYNKQGKEVSFVLDKKLFNEKQENNYYTITIKRKNEITGQPLTFKIGQHTSFDFVSGEKIDFDIIIKNNKLWTIDGNKLQTGNFILKKKSSP